MATKTKQTTAATEASVVEPVEAVEKETEPSPAPKKSYRVKRDLSPDTIVTIKNGFHGKLVYKSRRTGEVIVWEDFMAEQDVELGELKAAKASDKAFYKNNWFLIDDPEILEYLGVTQFYKYALNSQSFDELFYKTADEITEAVKKLSEGQKRSVAYRAKYLIENGELDTLSVINALEKSLDTELIER